MTSTPSNPDLSPGHALPSPVYHLTDLYEDEGFRVVKLAGRAMAEVDEILQRITWSVAASTAAQYTPYIRNYFSLAQSGGRDPYALPTLVDWIYALAYPRLRYLEGLGLGVPPLPARHQPGLGRGTLTVAVAAVTQAWATMGHQAPSDHAPWRQWLRGLRRRLRQELDRKGPLLRSDLQLILHAVEECPNPLTRARDRALILIGWSAALRAGELGAMKISDIVERHGQWFLTVASSKTDQMGAGSSIPLYPAREPGLDPLHAWQRWLRESGLHEGPAFPSISRSGTFGRKGLSKQAIGDMIKRYSPKRGISGHSLRIGYITQAKMDGHENWRVRLITRHRSDHMVDAYTRPDHAYREGPGSLL